MPLASATAIPDCRSPNPKSRRSPRHLVECVHPTVDASRQFQHVLDLALAFRLALAGQVRVQDGHVLTIHRQAISGHCPAFVAVVRQLSGEAPLPVRRRGRRGTHRDGNADIRVAGQCERPAAGAVESHLVATPTQLLDVMRDAFRIAPANQKEVRVPNLAMQISGRTAERNPGSAPAAATVAASGRPAGRRTAPSGTPPSTGTHAWRRSRRAGPAASTRTR